MLGIIILFIILPTILITVAICNKKRNTVRNSDNVR